MFGCANITMSFNNKLDAKHPVRTPEGNFILDRLSLTQGKGFKFKPTLM